MRKLAILGCAAALFTFGCSQQDATVNPIDRANVGEGVENYEELVATDFTNELLEDKGEYCLVGGDMILSKKRPDHVRLIKVLHGDDSSAASAGLSKSGALLKKYVEPWPNGVVSYRLEGFTRPEKRVIRRAMESIEKLCNVDWDEDDGGWDAGKYVIKKVNTTDYAGQSELGYSSLTAVNCNISQVDWGICVHEFLHGLGFSHEHQRDDRPISVMNSNLKDDAKRQLKVIPEWKWFGRNAYNIGHYDYNSIMHYPSFIPSYAIDTSRRVIEAGEFNNVIGQRFHISDGDEQGLTSLYGRGWTKRLKERSCDGDHKADLIFHQPGDNSVHIALSNGSRFVNGHFAPHRVGNQRITDRSRIFFGDFNGNGMVDLAFTTDDGRMRIHIGNGGWFTGAGSGDWLGSNEMGGTWGRYYPGDYNGDGRDDMLFFEAGNNSFHVAVSNGRDFVDGSQWIGPNGFGSIADNYFPADFNGDGKTDLGYLSGSSAFYVTLSTGSGFGPVKRWLNSGQFGGTWGKYYTGDFDGKGKDDLLFFEPSNNSFHVAVSNGSDFVNGRQWIGPNGFGDRPDFYFPADFTGDGKTDLGYLARNNQFFVTTSTGSGFGGSGSGVWIDANWGGNWGTYYVGAFAR